MKQLAKIPAVWKWGFAFFIGLFGIVMWAQIISMPTRIFLLVLTVFLGIFSFIWLFIQIYNWLSKKIDQWLKTTRPIDKVVISISKFFIAIALFLFLLCIYLFTFYRILILIKLITK